LALAPGWRSTQHEAIAASQCAVLDGAARRNGCDPSLSADPFEEVRLIHRRA